jgi:hypothetical protein
MNSSTDTFKTIQTISQNIKSNSEIIGKSEAMTTEHCVKRFVSEVLGYDLLNPKEVLLNMALIFLVRKVKKLILLF